MYRFRVLLDRVLAQMGYIPDIRWKTLKKQSEKILLESDSLKKEMLELEDENKSLWEMLDELKLSESYGITQLSSAMDEMKELMTDEMIKNFNPIGEA
jgi:hypothetical protein